MSWSYNKLGKAGKLAEVIKRQVAGVGGCPKGSAEEFAKNQVGEMLEPLLKSLPAEKIVKIDASGSAWNQSDGSALSQNLKIELITVGDLIE